MNSLKSIVVLLSTVLLIGGVCFADNWPQFRGPNRDGISTESGLLRAWPEAGPEVLWENRGRNDHNVLPVDETEDWGAQTEDFVPGDEYARVFDTPGEYPYYCSIHGTTDVGMIGTVIVTG